MVSVEQETFGVRLSKSAERVFGRFGVPGHGVLALCVLLFGLAGLSRPSVAQNAACRGLQAQLTKLDRSSSGGSPNFRKWSKSVADQKQAIRQTQRQARAGKCSTNGKKTGSTRHPKCGQIENTLSRMSANLAKLERRRDRYAGNGNNTAKARRTIQRKMNNLQCGAKKQRKAEKKAPTKTKKKVSKQQIQKIKTRKVEQRKKITTRKRTATQQPRSQVLINPGRRQREGEPRQDTGRQQAGSGLFSLLFGQPVRNQDRSNERRYERPSSRVKFRRSRRTRDRRRDSVRFGNRSAPEDDFFDDFPSGNFSGTYRTMCVRQCDGYYFPISFSTTEAMFGRDADMCSQRCPSGDAELFVHENPGGTPENMTSLDGRAYTDLPNAFQYRRAFKKGCSCSSAYGKVTTLSRLHLGGSVLQIRKRQPDTQNGVPSISGEAAASVPGLPLPLSKRPYDLDPESRLNLIGRYVPIGRVLKTPATATTARQSVRIVGPKYFYSQ